VNQRTLTDVANALRLCGVDERAILADGWGKWIRSILPLQRLDRSDQDGGFEDGDTGGWCDGRETAYRLARLIAGACWGDLIDVDHRVLQEGIRRAAKFIVRRQSPNGLMDMIGIYAVNEAGFPVPGLVAAYKHLAKADPILFEEIAADLKQYILRACEAVLAGSAHTANHRWTAACAPLAAAYSVWPDDRYLAKINDYLSDGIDCDENGFWYEERSPNYNMVANSGLAIIADCLNRPELLKPILRNFHFILHMIQPNGEADSSFSHRQDRAAANRSPCSYNMARRAAQLSGDGRFTTLALEAISRWPELIYAGVPVLFDVEDHPEDLPAPLPLPTEYERFFEDRAIARIRRGSTALTLAADHGGHFYSDVRDQWGGKKYSDDWFHLHHEDIVVQSIHLAPACMLAIQPREMRRNGEGAYELAGESRGWTHTLHFRPGSPPTEMRWDLKHFERIHWKDRSILIHLRCTAAYALIASLNLWIRPGIEMIEDGEVPKQINAGEVIHLRGGRPITFVSASGNKLRLAGLPLGQHRMRILPPEPIPSAKPKECGLLCLGMRLPTDLEFQFTY